MPRRPALLLGIALFGLAPLPARAQKLDKDDKKFLDEVRPILLPEEEKTFKGLKDRADRLEFQKIFWARRDPNLDTPQNEYQAEYQKAVAEADAQFKTPGHPGSGTDCGRVFILLGKPDEVKKEEGGVGASLRLPETWTYKDRPGVRFQGGSAQMFFDADCRLPPGAPGEVLDRLAADRVAHPNIDYRFSREGRLTKLLDLLPKPSPARALILQPRQDFPLASETAFLKVQDGGTAVVGMLRGEAAGFATEESDGHKVVKLVVCGQALGADGVEAAAVERRTAAEVQPDGTFLASFRLGLKPGKYTLRAGALEEKSGKGSVASSPIEVPDYGSGELGMASLMVLREVRDTAPGADPDGPFSAFQLGNSVLVPYATHTLTKADAPSFFYQVYDLKVDEATGKAAGVAALSILKAGQSIAQAPPQTLEKAFGGSVVGPVPLKAFEPGPYTIQLKVTDQVAKKDKLQEVVIEVKP